jgi:hypothetical protein
VELEALPDLGEMVTAMVTNLPTQALR